MIGESWIREQGMQDALLCAALRDRDMEDVPLWQRKFPERDAYMKHWDNLTPMRDGPVNPERREINDLQQMNEEIKRRAKLLGAADTGMTALKPEFIELGVEEMFASDALTLGEWADRVDSVLPRDRLTIEMEIAGPDTRRVTLSAPLDQKPTLLEIQAAWLTKCST